MSCRLCSPHVDPVEPIIEPPPYVEPPYVPGRFASDDACAIASFMTWQMPSAMQSMIEDCMFEDDDVTSPSEWLTLHCSRYSCLMSNMKFVCLAEPCTTTNYSRIGVGPGAYAGYPESLAQQPKITRLCQGMSWAEDSHSMHPCHTVDATRPAAPTDPISAKLVWNLNVPSCRQLLS